MLATLTLAETFVEFVWTQSVEKARLARLFAVITARLLASSKPWSLVKGPLAATFLSLSRVGWHMQSPFNFVGHEGFAFSIFQVSPRMFNDRVKCAVAHLDFLSAATRFGLPIPEVPLPLIEPLLGVFKDKSLDALKPAIR